MITALANFQEGVRQIMQQRLARVSLVAIQIEQVTEVCGKVALAVHLAFGARRHLTASTTSQEAEAKQVGEGPRLRSWASCATRFGAATQLRCQKFVATWVALPVFLTFDAGFDFCLHSLT